MIPRVTAAHPSHGADERHAARRRREARRVELAPTRGTPCRVGADEAIAVLSESEAMDRELPQGFEVRRAGPADAAAVAALVAASQEAFQGETEISRASVLRKWRAPRFDLERDAWLVQTEDGHVIAFGAVREAGAGGQFEGNFTVHPDYYGRGVAAYLLGRLEERVRAAATARSSYSVDGSGVRVGVLSDSVRDVIGGTLTGQCLSVSGGFSMAS